MANKRLRVEHGGPLPSKRTFAQHASDDMANGLEIYTNRQQRENDESNNAIVLWEEDDDDNDDENTQTGTGRIIHWKR